MKPTSKSASVKRTSITPHSVVGAEVVTSPEATVRTTLSERGTDAFRFQRDWPILWPIVSLLATSAVLRWTGVDLAVSELFYDRQQRFWPYELAQPWLWFYRQGTIPSVVLGFSGAIVALFGRWVLPRGEWRRSKAIRQAGMFLFALLIVGPGLIVNVVFKDSWGRPRPIQCVEFNGEKSFLPVGTWSSDPSPNSSFPSGHAAVAFYLMAPGFVMGQRRPRLTAAFFLGGACYGLGMGLTRVVQGGHFVTDVLWAGAMVYFTGTALAWLILRNDERTYPIVHHP